MKKLQCDCGHEVSADTNESAEAQMWHHALKDHADMLKSMSVDQMTQIIKAQHATLAAQ